MGNSKGHPKPAGATVATAPVLDEHGWRAEILQAGSAWLCCCHQPELGGITDPKGGYLAPAAPSIYHYCTCEKLFCLGNFLQGIHSDYWNRNVQKNHLIVPIFYCTSFLRALHMWKSSSYHSSKTNSFCLPFSLCMQGNVIFLRATPLVTPELENVHLKTFSVKQEVAILYHA